MREDLPETQRVIFTSPDKLASMQGAVVRFPNETVKQVALKAKKSNTNKAKIVR